MKDKQNYLCEADGTCGTGLKRCGPICEEKKAAYRETRLKCESLRAPVQQAASSLGQAEQRLSQATKDLEASLRRREDEIDREYRRAINRLDSPHRASFLARSEALGRLTADRWKAFITVLFVSLLFIFVEVVPVFMTIITPADSADTLAGKIRDAFESERRITALAEEILDTAKPPPLRRDAEPMDAAAPAEGAETGRTNIRRIGILVGPALIMSVMIIAGTTKGEAISAAALFVTVFLGMFHDKGSRRPPDDRQRSKRAAA